MSEGEKLETAMQRLLLTDASVEAPPGTFSLKRDSVGVILGSY